MPPLSSDGTLWREKYLSLLKECEKNELLQEKQQEVLQKLITRVCFVAQGQNQQVDEVLGHVRHALREPSEQQLDDLVTQLNDVSMAFERERERQGLEIRTHLRDSVSDWLSFAINNALKKYIKDFVQSLPTSVDTLDGFYQFSLGLRDIQKQALAQVQQSSPSVLKHFFSKKILPLGEEKAGELFENQESLSDVQLSAEKLQSAQEPAPVILYCKNNWRKILSPLLEALRPYHSNQAAIDAFSQSLNDEHSPLDGMDVINQLYVFIYQVISSSQNSFKQYLDCVNHDLIEINQLILESLGVDELNNHQQLQWHEHFTAHIDDLDVISSESCDVEQLKKVVHNQLINLRQSLDQKRKAESEHNQLGDVLSQLKTKVQILEKAAQENSQHLAEQYYKAHHDALTGLPNRYAYEERMTNEHQRYLRYDRPLVIAIFDIDYFKRINDEYGHQAGDRVISVIGKSIAKRLRDVDFFGRYGGEEFVALLPETELPEAVLLLDKIRHVIARASFNYKDKPLQITISIGLTQLVKTDTIESAFDRADRALYAAKAAGRNCLRTQ